MPRVGREASLRRLSQLALPPSRLLRGHLAALILAQSALGKHVRTGETMFPPWAPFFFAAHLGAPRASRPAKPAFGGGSTRQECSLPLALERVHDPSVGRH